MHSIERVADYGMTEDWSPVAFAAQAVKVGLEDARRIGMTPHRVNQIDVSRLRMRLPDFTVMGFTECADASITGRYESGILQRTWKGSSPVGFGLHRLPQSPPEAILITQGALNYLILDSLLHATGAEMWVQALGVANLNDDDTSALLTLNLVEEIYHSACQNILVGVLHQYSDTQVDAGANVNGMWPGSVLFLEDLFPIGCRDLVSSAQAWHSTLGADWLLQMGTVLASRTLQALPT